MSSLDLIEEALTSGQARPSYAAVAATAPEPGAPNAIVQESESTDATSQSTAEPEAWKDEYDARSRHGARNLPRPAKRLKLNAQRRASGVPETNEDIPTGLPTHKPPVVANPKDEVETPLIEREGPASVHPDSNEGSQAWEALPKASQPPSTQTTTLAIFDETLSTRTRALALLSSLAINLALPFVNGVMLGFGEIFAKNVVMDWLGWKRSTTASQRKSIFKS
ncbi:hypothetical protein BKA70DRAFT_1261741 [Coprinopsis sp. MPI-PUGE-AT-0042]|nr:hypothetical protein BKA70DRAFT_1261741 [Coprinopsis sp. MPI-PUGE-AT-0042]